MSSIDQEKRPAELPMSESNLSVENNTLQLRGKIKHCTRNAYVNLRKSWTLHPVDSEMSLFRAITAEEEAATALMLALKQQHYPNAEQLNPRNHTHKSAFTPFLNAVNNVLAKTDLPKLELTMSKQGRPQIHIRLKIQKALGSDEPMFIKPDQPLNFAMGLENSPTSHSRIFDDELRMISEGRRLRNIVSLVRKEANLRNEILYACDTGVPTVEFPDSLIIDRLRRVNTLHILTIAILQTSSHQLFAIQCLESFLTTVGKLPKLEHDFAAITKFLDLPKLK